MGARSSHMIDNKWVDVRPHGGSAFSAASFAEKEFVEKNRNKDRGKEVAEPDTNQEDYEDKWSQKYLTLAAQVGALQDEDTNDGFSTTEAVSMLGSATTSQDVNPCLMGSISNMHGNVNNLNTMSNMGNMAGMCNMGNMGNMSLVGSMDKTKSMALTGSMHPMMSMMVAMNPCMLGMMGAPSVGMINGGRFEPEVRTAGSRSSGPVREEHGVVERASPY